ncbi:MAG: endolytic transglycosylase MltG [Bacteroidales bacterium]|jgi:UPF0755 protein|nr:endolytic transglycosylase MltG [Bacteroidales bacterium]
MKKVILVWLIVATVCSMAAAIFGYAVFYKPNIQNSEPYHLTIKQNTDKQQVLEILNANHVIKNSHSFRIAAQLLRFNRVKKGKYILRYGENNLNIIRMLRKGQHYPVKFTFNNIRTQEQFVDRVGNRFIFEPETLDSLLSDSSYMAQFGVNPYTKLTIFIPNSYEFYYDITADEFIHKMYEEYLQFWTPQRLSQAHNINLSPAEVLTLASIVEEENFKNSEKAIIAGLYINRLKKNMLLQSDPTVKYAAGDFTLKRVLTQHTQADSPYNTYRHLGLPPGPIRMPAISSIDSVLQYRKHNYLYMCAKEDFSGAHNFAVTLAEHERNAARYHHALNRLK